EPYSWSDVTPGDRILRECLIAVHRHARRRRAFVVARNAKARIGLATRKCVHSPLRPEIREPALAVRNLPVDIPTQPGIHGQPWRHVNIVLKVTVVIVHPE